MVERRVDVIDELLAAMSARDRIAVEHVLVTRQPSRDEIDAASALRRLDLWLDATIST